MDLQARWDELLLCLERVIAPDEVRVWFRDVRPVELRDARLLLEAGNRYYIEWIRDNYLPELETQGARVFGHPIQVAFQVVDELEDPGSAPDEHRAPDEPARPRSTGLNTGHTFDTFVVGECNKLGHAAAQAVADNPSVTYNPLYIYGHTGLGKTHLMHAIGNEVVRRDPTARVVYVTAEDFTNEMINSIRFKRTEQFREKYRETATLLLVDDIQFLSGKERTQEEFFFTFNKLQEAGRQIVLTSDVEPKDIQGLTPRLRTRFEGGLLADMQPPDIETLLAILHRKADAARFRLPDDLAAAIAEIAAGNVRELEGIIHRLGALMGVHAEPLTLEFARRHLPKLFVPEPAQVTVAGIIESVARYHNIRSADITGKRRTRALTKPRHMAMYLARVHTRLSFPELGREFGDRDHSTIQHGYRKVEKELVSDTDLSYQLRVIEQGLGLRQR